MTQKQSNVLQALLTTSTKEAAAELAGVNRKTVDGYLQDQAFRDEYDRRRRAQVDDACQCLQQAMSEAVSALCAILRDDTATHPARIQAARCVLDYGIKLTELTDIEARLAALEKAQQEATRHEH